MKLQICVICLGAILLSACGNSEQEAVKKVVPNQDTTEQELPSYLNDPKKNINVFGIEIDYSPLKAIFDRMIADADIQIKVKTDLCAGDNCTSYKILTDTLTKTKLFLIKSDYGEYGSANNQFLIRNDSLVLYRNYEMGPDLLTDTSTVYTFGLGETIYEFDADKVRIKKRAKIQSDQRNYTLQDVRFSDSLSTRFEAEKYCKDQLGRLLDIEKIAE